eukprot:TRINITY_DN84199_c0_g1_i1.p1 TRINITY_DN84199_c0_g1~~TRINITY_DN84199_c0_g1_i1.p1  ORF type:complete len:236 (-),score=2.62 TRINITY_DN84199_c0_g1_i1:80-787(-)
MLKRIMKEWKDLEKLNPPHVDIRWYQHPKTNSQCWLFTILPPVDSLYSEGTYHICVQFPTDYPFKPCRTQFFPAPFSAFVNMNGEICQCGWNQYWSPAFTVWDMIKSDLTLLSNPDVTELTRLIPGRQANCCYCILVPEVCQMYQRQPEEFKKRASSRAKQAQYSHDNVSTDRPWAVMDLVRSHLFGPLTWSPDTHSAFPEQKRNKLRVWLMLNDLKRLCCELPWDLVWLPGEFI